MARSYLLFRSIYVGVSEPKRYMRVAWRMENIAVIDRSVLLPIYYYIGRLS